MIFQAVGCICKLTLGKGFSELNGMYYVSLEMTFKDAIASSVDFMANLYTPAGKSASDYSADYNNYLDDVVLVCNPIDDRSVSYYIPQSLLIAPPDPTVKTYYRRMALIDLGIVDDPNTLLPLFQQLGQIATATTGILDCVTSLADTKSPVYKTQADYQAYLDQQAANKSTITNPVVRNIQLESENAQLRSRLAIAEKALIEYLVEKETPKS